MRSMGSWTRAKPRAPRSMTLAFRRQLVGDALVAIDAGSPLALRDFMYFRRDRGLFFRIHAVETVAIAAFARIGFLHGGPDSLRQLGAVGLEFLRGVDQAGNLAIEFAARFDLTHDLVNPILGDMTIGADCAHAGRIGEMYCLPVL